MKNFIIPFNSIVKIEYEDNKVFINNEDLLTAEVIELQADIIVSSTYTLLGTTRTATQFTTEDITIREGEKAIFRDKNISFNDATVSGGTSLSMTEGNLSRSGDKSKLEIIRFDSISLVGASVTTSSPETTVSTDQISFTSDF